MNQDIRKEEILKYIHYFRVWFLLAGILLIAFLILLFTKPGGNSAVRSNDKAPGERVYDYAQVLTDQEEDSLRELIARREAQIGYDIVLVTIKEQVETGAASWESAMRNLADDFYDQNYYGYNGPAGDGVLLLDNWQEGQKGSWLSTCAGAIHVLGQEEIDKVLDKVYDLVEQNPYKAYKAYIEEIYRQASGRNLFLTVLLIFVIPVIVLLVFVFTNLKAPLAQDTAGASEYVAGRSPRMRVSRDDFLRKQVTSRRIPKNDSGSGGGSHTSSSGVSHGGGGRRR